MNDKAMVLEFHRRKDFRAWLAENKESSEGVWIVFTKGNKVFTPNDALEEAICFGWIDGLLKSIDERTYKKYFSQRKDRSNWSEKNRSLFHKLKETGVMTEYGVAAFRCESENESGGAKTDVHEMNIEILKNALRNDEDSLEAFEKASPSRQKRFAGFYCEAKTDETREKRKGKITEAIKKDSKGMLY